MKINKKLVIFTYGFPTGKGEKTFIKYELDQLKNIFKEIEIIPQKKFDSKQVKSLNKNIKINFNLSFKLNKLNILFKFFLHTIFEKDFYREIYKILFKKNFLIKLKMLTIELTMSEITYEWILKNKLNDKKDLIFYSFWSNYILLSFEKLKRTSMNYKTIARSLGSDLNGYIKNDDYVPYIEKKFFTLDKLFLLSKFQKKILLKKKLINKNKIKIAPLGVYKIRNRSVKTRFSSYNILSCNNLIKIKNNLQMINFVKVLSEYTNKKVKFYIIGDGPEYNKISKKLLNYKKLFNYKLLKKTANLPKFIISKNIHFFLNLSSQEGMSFSIMEAMSCGIPVISSNIEANKYLVNKSRGYIININNYEKSFISNAKLILKDIKSNAYLSKQSKALSFVNKNLQNKECFKFFLKELKKL